MALTAAAPANSRKANAMTVNLPPTVTRRPRVGDVVTSRQTGALYEVESIYTDGLSRIVSFYSVIDLATHRYPNTFRPDEVAVLTAAAQAEARAATSFDATQEDWWVCVCGNDPHGAGLYHCDADGNAMEPLVGSGWAGHYYCSSCGRYGSQNDRTPEGRVPVLGYAKHFTDTTGNTQPGPESWGADPDHTHDAELAED